MRNVVICAAFKGVNNKKCPNQPNLWVTVLHISLIVFIIFPLLLWALTSGQRAAVGHKNIKISAVFFIPAIHAWRRAICFFKSRTELTDVWEKNTTCKREAVNSRRLQIHQQQRKHYSNLISQPGMQLLNRLINIFVDGKCAHNRRLLFFFF